MNTHKTSGQTQGLPQTLNVLQRVDCLLVCKRRFVNSRRFFCCRCNTLNAQKAAGFQHNFDVLLKQFIVAVISQQSGLNL